MAYTVNYTDNTKTAITLSNGTIDTSTNIGLVGQGYSGYGETIAEDLLHIMEHHASGTAPSKPVEGQLWYDSTNDQLKYFNDTVANSGDWIPIASMAAQSSQPTAGGQDGHFWLNISDGTLYIYHSGVWHPVSNVGGTTRVLARIRYDTSDVFHHTFETIVDGEIVSIVSSDAPWSPQSSGANTEYLEDLSTLLNTEFPTLKQGINLNNGTNYVFNGTATSALYADIAERYEADEPMDPGTVVLLGGVNEVTTSFRRHDVNVFGVVSTNPGFMMNADAGNDETHPYIALAGRVPVKAVGKINKGDRVVTSNTAGHVEKLDPGMLPDWRIVVGRAVTDKNNGGAGLVEIVVGAK